MINKRNKKSRQQLGSANKSAKKDIWASSDSSSEIVKEIIDEKDELSYKDSSYVISDRSDRNGIIVCK